MLQYLLRIRSITVLGPRPRRDPRRTCPSPFGSRCKRTRIRPERQRIDRRCLDSRRRSRYLTCLLPGAWKEIRRAAFPFGKRGVSIRAEQIGRGRITWVGMSDRFAVQLQAPPSRRPDSTRCPCGGIVSCNGFMPAPRNAQPTRERAEWIPRWHGVRPDDQQATLLPSQPEPGRRAPSMSTGRSMDGCDAHRVCVPALDG